MTSLSESTFPITEIRSLFCMAGTGERLRDPHLSFYYAMGSLNERIQKVDGRDSKNALLKGIWKEFYTAICAHPSPANQLRLRACFGALKEYFPERQDLGIFSDTDLIVFPDEYEECLPINGVGGEEFAEILELYEEFISHLSFHCDEACKEQIMKDIRFILTRPMGRQLIGEILQHMQPDQMVHLRRADTCSFLTNGETSLICYTPESKVMIQVLPNGEMMTLKSPSFINLAHELIHLHHKLSKKIDHTDAETPDPTVPHLNSNREESLTIFGDCGTPLATRCHSISTITDNGMRAQFIGLLQRGGHRTGIDVQGDAKSNFKYAAKHDIRGNVRMLMRHVSTGTRDQVIRQNNPSGALTVMIEEARKDRSLREGMLSTVTTPQPPTSSSSLTYADILGSEGASSPKPPGSFSSSSLKKY